MAHMLNTPHYRDHTISGYETPRATVYKYYKAQIDSQTPPTQSIIATCTLTRHIESCLLSLRNTIRHHTMSRHLACSARQSQSSKTSHVANHVLESALASKN